jgi:hypothetical protein
MKTLLKNFAKRLKTELKETAINANYVLSR